MESFIGSTIQLISKSEVRYVGILSHLDPAAGNIALSQVRSFGTETRTQPTAAIPPSDVIYEYIVFRSSDIKDISVLNSASIQQQPGLPRDPAVLSVNHGPNTWGYYGNMGMAGPSLGTNQFGGAGGAGYSALGYGLEAGMQGLSLKPPSSVPPQTLGVSTGVITPSLPSQIKTEHPNVSMSKSPRMSPKKSAEVVEAPVIPAITSLPEKKDKYQEQVQKREVVAKEISSEDRVVEQRPHRVEYRTAARNTDHGNQERERENRELRENRGEERYNRYSEGRNDSEGYRGGRGRGRGRFNQSRAHPVPSTDFDFEQANAKFQGISPTDEEVAPPTTFYEKSSFFDNISSDAVTKEKRVPREERKLNMETFGVSGLRGRGRGRGRGGYRGRGRRPAQQEA